MTTATGLKLDLCKLSSDSTPSMQKKWSLRTGTTGISLTMAHDIVRRHGGDIRARSA